MALPGIHEATYNAEQDIFEVRYEEGRISVPAIFAAVHQAGRQMGREYLPEALA
ncbi:MAG: hypothetical protein QME75_03545 [Deltaproteobacteria bacterium]|nr:hypothetical protein [Deltaproteobacteria bacterium]